MKKGFTLIEMLVVIGIIAILTGVLISTFSGSSESATTVKCQANMRNLAMAVQAAGVANKYHPAAGSYKQYYQNSGRDRKVASKPGWISWTEDGNYMPTDTEDLEYCITNGAIWAYMNGARDCYCCPAHIKKCGGNTPNWSYVMSAYFKWGSNSSPRSENWHGHIYGDMARRDRYLLFAEIDWAGTTEEETDPILQYKDCEGGGNEEIQFHHKDGKNEVALVCFADGHVEKLRKPQSGNMQEVTKWFCRPKEDNGNEFDIVYESGAYRKVTQ